MDGNLSRSDIKFYSRLKNINYFKWFRIFVFEFTGTFILIYGIMSSQYVTPPYPVPPDYQPILNPTHSVFNSFALFLVLCFSGQLTGGHCNPAVTIALLISKGNKITWSVALAYIISQFLGALAGGAVAYGLVLRFNFLETVSDQSVIAVLELKILLGQIFGTFFYTLFVLIIMNDHTSFVKSTFWNYCLIPVVNFIAREASYQIESLNPATVFSFQLFTGLKDGNWVPLSHYYLYFFGPLLGACLSGCFFNFFYLPLLIRWKAKK